MSKTSHILSKQNSQQPKQFRGGEKKVMKKSLSLLVAIAMVFSMFATLVSADGKTAGQKLQETGLITGTSAGLDEDKEWLRQDVTVLISRLLNKEEEAKAHENTHGFEDLDSKFYNGFVSWAKETGLFIGKSATKFGVGESITNQEYATVLLRVFNQLQGVTEDVDYSTAYETAVELGLISKDLDPKANAVRGDIYESLVLALDYKINGKKVGTILGLKGYEITDVAVVGAKATNSKTIEVEFNQDVADVVASNFSVSKKANETVEVIASVATSGAKATITLVDSLSNNTEYVVTATGVTSKDASVALGEEVTADFTYVATSPVSVEIPTTTVAYDQEVKYVIKDANGNDITVDVAEGDIEVFSTNESVVEVDGVKLVAQNLSGVSKTTDYAVVQVVVTLDDEEGSKIETPATVITVQPSVAVINGITKVSFNPDFDKDAETALFIDESKELNVQIKDASGNVITSGVELSFRSANPTVLVIDNDGVAYGVKAGSATVSITAKFNGKTVTHSQVITVRDEAKLSSLDFDKASVKLVYGLDNPIDEKVKVTLKNQYNEKFTGENLDVKVRSNKKDLLTVNGFDFPAANTDVTVGNIVDGDNIELVIGLDDNVDAATTATLRVTVGNVNKTISVSIVKGGALAGYVAEITATEIDLNTTNEDHKLDANDATVSVYARDNSGNKIAELSAGEFVLVPEKEEFLTTAVDKVNPTKVGTERVYVTVNELRVATFSVKVVDTTPALTKVTQVKNAVTVTDGNLVKALFGENKDGNAFVGYDQYNNKFVIDADADVKYYSNNQGVVNNDGALGGENGTALVTLLIKDKAYTITVVVR